MWDRKRQIVWIAAGLILGTYISYSDSLDEQGNFVPRFFVFMETLVLIIMGVLFYLYSMKKQWISDFRLKIVLCTAFFVLRPYWFQDIVLTKGQSTKDNLQSEILNLKFLSWAVASTSPVPQFLHCPQPTNCALDRTACSKGRMKARNGSCVTHRRSP